MENVLIQNLMSFSKDKENIECKIAGKKLDGLSKILNVANKEYSYLEDASFFEFGSAHYNPSTYTVRSAKNSHFMGLGTNLKYQCFDAYVEESDFDIVNNLKNAFISAEKVTSDYIGLRVKYGDPMWGLAVKEFLSLDEKKDFSDIFAKISSKEYYDKFFGFYDKTDMKKLKEDIEKFSTEKYEEILKKINSSPKPVIFSSHVLNAPNLSFDFPFWKIDKGFQIHYGNIRELMEYLSFDPGWKFSATDGKVFEEKGKFLDKFQKRFKLDAKNLNLFNEDSTFLLYWNCDN